MAGTQFVATSSCGYNDGGGRITSLALAKGTASSSDLGNSIIWPRGQAACARYSNTLPYSAHNSSSGIRLVRAAGVEQLRLSERTGQTGPDFSNRASNVVGVRLKPLGTRGGR